MAGSVQDALADVAVRLESLKAALGDKQAAADRDADQLAAIQRMAHELQSLLHEQPQQAQGEALQEQGPQEAVPAVQAGPVPPAAAAQLPSTPFEQRRAPGPAAKPSAPTPGGLPATTPLAAEVLASLNAVAGAGAGADPPAAAWAADDADDAAAATLSGMLGGLDPRGSGASICGLPPARAQQQQEPSLATLLQEVSLAPPMPAHSAAMAAAAAAAAAAAPPMPAPRRASAAVAAQALPFAAAPPREQRPCNCKRSMCLKMYCECFAAGGFCAPTCSCANCSNSPTQLGAVLAAREVVLAKNPRAFEVKVTATEGHKRGCRCKRSKCLKKYCECFHAGARCNPDVCQCEDCRNTEGDAMPLPVLSKRGSSAAAGAAAAAQQVPAWADTSADVLAMFQQQPPLPLPAAGDASGGSNSSGSSGRRGRARAQALPLPLLPGGFSLAGLPPMPEPAGPGAFNPAAAAAAAVLGSLPPAGLFAPLAPPAAFDPAAAAAFMLNPVAAAAATIAAAATLAEQQQQQLEESMADAVSCPAGTAAAAGAAAQPPAAAAAAATPGGFKVASALTSHLSDVACAADSEMHDTATSPAPHMAIAKLAARRTLLAGAAAATLTGGGAGPMGRPPLPPSRVRSRANSGDDSQLSQGSADENGGDSLNTAGSQRSKRPRRAASGGVLGAVAAETSEWGLDVVSPPLKRANSLPVALEKEGKAGGRGKAVSDRVALLKKALAGETAAVARQLVDGCAAAAAEAEAPPTAEDEDAISALFELSSSVC